ncbi:TPA: hypothetical protein ACTZGK_004101 [Raoultella planticola]|uniref:hypothetical protein n=1 Tax=Klebsiella TaxID=570 RepID=UPI000A0F3E39|nr:hypothetical protein [Klebsiella quasipneumoniae]EIV6184302.1 hypothetical protein [Klebsiella aerogenes]SMG72954.1 Uncharacterised protein [Klebsiella quasipneumoniae]
MIPTIEPFLYGRNISDISEKHFAPWFCPNDEYPVLVLASTITVPDSPSQDWFLGEEQCGGYSCNQFQAAVLPLKILPEKIVLLEQVAGEVFCPKSLDYFNFDSDEVRQCIRRDYQSFVMSAGLTCSDDNALLLTQPLYPLDASESNLRALTSDQINLDRLNVSNGLVLFVVGVNCD